MWILFFIIALLFVLGNALILLRTAKASKLPDTIKPQPYDNNESGGW